MKRKKNNVKHYAFLSLSHGHCFQNSDFLATIATAHLHFFQVPETVKCCCYILREEAFTAQLFVVLYISPVVVHQVCAFSF